MYFQCAATLRAVGALLRDTDTSNRLPLVNRAGAGAFHLRPVDGMFPTVHETSESNGEFEKNYQLISIRFHKDNNCVKSCCEEGLFNSHSAMEVGAAGTV